MRPMWQPLRFQHVCASAGAASGAATAPTAAPLTNERLLIFDMFSSKKSNKVGLLSIDANLSDFIQQEKVAINQTLG